MGNTVTDNAVSSHVCCVLRLAGESGSDFRPWGPWVASHPMSLFEFWLQPTFVVHHRRQTKLLASCLMRVVRPSSFSCASLMLRAVLPVWVQQDSCARRLGTLLAHA